MSQQSESTQQAIQHPFGYGGEWSEATVRQLCMTPVARHCRSQGVKDGSTIDAATLLGREEISDTEDLKAAISGYVSALYNESLARFAQTLPAGAPQPLALNFVHTGLLNIDDEPSVEDRQFLQRLRFDRYGEEAGAGNPLYADNFAEQAASFGRMLDAWVEASLEADKTQAMRVHTVLSRAKQDIPKGFAALTQPNKEDFMAGSVMLDEFMGTPLHNLAVTQGQLHSVEKWWTTTAKDLCLTPFAKHCRVHAVRPECSNEVATFLRSLKPSSFNHLKTAALSGYVSALFNQNVCDFCSALSERESCLPDCKQLYERCLGYTEVSELEFFLKAQADHLDEPLGDCPDPLRGRLAAQAESFDRIIRTWAASSSASEKSDLNHMLNCISGVKQKLQDWFSTLVDATRTGNAEDLVRPGEMIGRMMTLPIGSFEVRQEGHSGAQ